MKLLAFSVVGLVSTFGSFAQAQEAVEAEEYSAPTERRGGFVLGLAPAYGLGQASGYPNEADKVNRKEFQANTEFGSAGYNSVWLGGALRDWFTVGLGASFGGVKGNHLSANGTSFVVRVEAFPLYARGGTWRDLGLESEFGAGFMKVKNEAGDTVADGGSLSLVGLGAFYEPWRFWQFRIGPSLQYSQMFSQTLTAHFVSLGLRASLYGSLVD